MHKSYKYRLYPNKNQQIMLNKTFGCCRVVWNNCVHAFRHQKDIYNLENNYGVPLPDDYIREGEYHSVKELRQQYNWLQEVSAGALNYKLRHFEQYKKTKFSNYNKVGEPKFKNKHSKQSFSLIAQKFDIKDNKIRLEKIGWINAVISQEIPSNARMISCTVSKNKAGQYFVSICVEQDKYKEFPKTGKTVGLDRGLKSYIVTSDNEIIDNPHYSRENQTRLARLQMFQSKKKGSRKGEEKSSRWLKGQLKISGVYLKSDNRRQDFLHKLTTRFVKEYDTICIEDLNVSGMMQNEKLSYSIGDASWYMFERMLTYKAGWYGKKVEKVPRFYPSSKTCSRCGCKNENLTLNDRIFVCPQCGLTIDRDYNAAINIKNTAVKGVAQSKTDADGEITNRAKRLEKKNCYKLIISHP